MAVGIESVTSLEMVAGIKLGTAASGARYKNRDDLLIIFADEGSCFAGVFTKNKFCAPPVVIARNNIMSTEPRACLVNAGNANAGTGIQGKENTLETCKVVSENLEISQDSVLPFSTGVIGEHLHVEKISAGIPICIDNLSENNWVKAAHSIMTTDAVAKGCSQVVDLSGEAVTITGIVKGSGMICPDMATLLAFVATDALIEKQLLHEMLLEVVAESFNRITVDGDTSTNDSCVLISTGKSKNNKLKNKSDPDCSTFYEALKNVFITLAQSVIRDAEGATKFVTINVINASSDADALEAALTIAHSPLVKTALFASDPNWGRILAALGRAKISLLEIQKVNLKINGVMVLKQGELNKDYSEDQGQAAMSKEDIVIDIDLGLGSGNSRVWTSDLSHEYIRINAEYRS